MFPNFLCSSLLESTLNRKEAYLLPFGCTFPESGNERPHFHNIQTPRAQICRWIFARHFDYTILELPKNQPCYLSRSLSEPLHCLQGLSRLVLLQKNLPRALTRKSQIQKLEARTNFVCTYQNRQFLSSNSTFINHFLSHFPPIYVENYEEYWIFPDFSPADKVTITWLHSHELSTISPLRQE